MYLSCLEIDSRSYKGCNWLSNPYLIHQRLLMGFDDGAESRLLFRLEIEKAPVRILVQSQSLPDWKRAFQNLPVLISFRVKQVDLQLSKDQLLRFFISANPTKRVWKACDGIPAGERIGLLREEDQRAWLLRKGSDSGFNPLSFTAISRGFRVSRRRPGSENQKMTHLQVDYEGILLVTDPDQLRATLETGLGPSKGFGFGLISLARA